MRSTRPSPRTPAGSGKFSPCSRCWPRCRSPTPPRRAGTFILGMLATGLIFIAVIAIGETSKYLRHRRERRRRPAY